MHIRFFLETIEVIAGAGGLICLILAIGNLIELRRTYRTAGRRRLRRMPQELLLLEIPISIAAAVVKLAKNAAKHWASIREMAREGPTLLCCWALLVVAWWASGITKQVGTRLSGRHRA